MKKLLIIGWFIPSMNALKNLIRFIDNKKTLEVGSGLGLIAALLNKSGCEIIPTDNFNDTYYRDNYETLKKLFMEIHKLEATEAVRTYRDTNTLLFCWPPMNDMAYRCIKMFSGNQIVFIGTYNDEYAEYNADNNFFEELKVNWTLVEKIDDILRWPDTADDMFFYKRKPALTLTALTSTALTSTKELKEKGQLDLVRIGRERGIPDEMINEMLENNITKLSFVKLLIKKQLETMDERPLIKYAREHGVSQEIINMYIDDTITIADFIGEILKIV